MRRVLLLLGVLALFGFTDLYGGGLGGDLDTKAPLVRPDDAPDGNAKGVVRVRQDDGQRLDVDWKKLPTGDLYSVLMETAAGSGLLQQIGADDDKLVFDTAQGDTLPFGVTCLTLLTGRLVHVLDPTDDLVLYGFVPPFLDDVPKTKGQAPMLPPPGAPVPDATGSIKMVENPSNGVATFAASADGLELVGVAVYSLFVETDVGSGTFALAGEMFPKPSNPDKAVFIASTAFGSVLPGGLLSAAPLQGRLVQVRDALDLVYLEGVAPTLE